MILIAAAYIVLKEKDLELKDMFSLQPRNWSVHRCLTGNHISFNVSSDLDAKEKD